MSRALFKILAALAILSLLWTAVPQAREIILAPLNMAQGTVVTVELHNLRKLVLIFQIEQGRLPKLAEFSSIVQTKLSSRIKNPAQDTWGTPYFYRYNGVAYELRSCGPDRRLFTEDDLYLNGTTG